MGSKKTKIRKQKTYLAKNISKTESLLDDLSIKEKYFERFLVVVLLAFGIYQSVLYFGHQVVPNPDFTSFVRLGHRLLSFQLPTNYKRAPVLGLLQATLSHLVGGQHPDLTAGWLLNAILHPLNLVLLWLVGKKIVGRTALWVAIIAIINPWVIQMLVEPIAETTLLFFVLLTFFFILKRSNWAYLFASIATVVRYDCAALILAAFVMEMIKSEGNKQRLKSFVYSALASIPLAIWMLGTILHWRSAGGTHYLKELGAGGAFTDTLVKYLELIWQVAFSSLFSVTSKENIQTLWGLSKILAAAGFVFGVIYGLCKRRWEFLGLLAFLIPYVVIHILHSFVIPRFCTPVYWIVLLISLYGFQSCWHLINKNDRVPRAIVIGLQSVAVICIIVWLFILVPYLSKLKPYSSVSVSIPYVSIGLLLFILTGHAFIYKVKQFWSVIVISVLIALMVVSNQFMLTNAVGNGQRSVEFKLLADWYIENAKPGEKMLTTMPNVVAIFAPKKKETLYHVSGIKAKNPNDFVSKCYEKDITYVVWDSRLGLTRGSRYYNLWGLENMAVLAKPRSIGPYEYITAIRVSQRRYVHIFRLKKLAGTTP